MLYVNKMLHRLVVSLFLLSTLFSNINYGLTNNINPISSGISTSGVSGALSWNSVFVGDQRVWYPEDNWQQYDQVNISFPTKSSVNDEIEFTRSRHGASMNNRQGMFSGTIGGDLAAEARSMNATQMTKTIEQLTEEEVIVVGRYSQQQGMGVIFGFKVHKKQSDKNVPMLSVESANFTPYHGQRWVITRSYLSDYEKGKTEKLGYNPFIMHTNWNNDSNNYGAMWNIKSPLPTGEVLNPRYKNDTDPTFYNISWEKFQVAIGHAMRYWNANAGYISTSNTRITSETQRRSGFFSSSSTTTWFTHIKPTWFVALSSQAQDGEVAYACALLNQNDCYIDNNDSIKTNHIATSGVAVAKWTGGGFFDYENGRERVHSHTQSGMGWFFFFLFIFVAVAIIALSGPLLIAGLFGLGAIFLIPRGLNAPRLGTDPNALRSFLADIFPAPSFYPTGVSLPSEQIYATLNADPLTNQKLSEKQLDDILIKILYPALTGHVGNGTLVNYNGARNFLNYGSSTTPSDTDLKVECESELKNRGDGNERAVRNNQCGLEYAKQIASEWNAKGGHIIHAGQRTIFGFSGGGFCNEWQGGKACDNLNDAGLIMRRDNINADKNATETKMLLDQKKNDECRTFLGTLERPTKGQMEEFYKCMRGE